MAPAPSPCRPRASTSTSMLGARPPMVSPATNTSTPATNGGAGPRRSAWPPATTMPTSTPSWKALVTHPYRRMPWRSSLIAGRMVMTARASKATRVMVRTRPMVSPRRAGVISPAGRLDDHFMVGPRGHATGRPPPLPPGLTGNGRVWKGTAVVGQPPNPPLGQRQAKRHARGARARGLAALVMPWPASPERLASLRNEPAPRGTRSRPRHARATSPWRGNLKMAALIVFPLLLAWALLPASAKPGGGRYPGQDPAAAAAAAPDAARLARAPDATAADRARRSRRTTTTTTKATTTTTRAATTTSRPPRTTAPPTTAAAPAGGGSTAQTLTNDLFDRLNAERRARGLAALKWDGDLARVAGDWSAQMARTGNFAHRDLGAAGGLPGMSKFSALGENIAWVEGYPSMGNQLHVGWMKSEGHRANMLQRGFDSVGIGVVCAGGRAWATQNFGRLDTSSAPSMSSSTPPENPIVATRDDGVRC